MEFNQPILSKSLKLPLLTPTPSYGNLLPKNNASEPPAVV